MGLRSTLVRVLVIGLLLGACAKDEAGTGLDASLPGQDSRPAAAGGEVGFLLAEAGVVNFLPWQVVGESVEGTAKWDGASPDSFGLDSIDSAFNGSVAKDGAVSVRFESGLVWSGTIEGSQLKVSYTDIGTKQLKSLTLTQATSAERDQAVSRLQAVADSNADAAMGAGVEKLSIGDYLSEDAYSMTVDVCERSGISMVYVAGTLTNIADESPTRVFRMSMSFVMKVKVSGGSGAGGEVVAAALGVPGGETKRWSGTAAVPGKGQVLCEVTDVKSVKT